MIMDEGDQSTTGKFLRKPGRDDGRSGSLGAHKCYEVGRSGKAVVMSVKAKSTSSS